MRRHTLQAAAAMLGAAVVLGGLIAGGRALRGRLVNNDQYQIPFAEIQCDSPPGMTREEFLGEVEYLSDFHSRVSLLDDAMPQQLQEAFLRHGWVESARILNGPGRKIVAELTFRTPVLAVQFANGVRVVDAKGLLLPRSAAVDGLPILSEAKPPSSAAGKPWGDLRVEAAARVAAALHPHQSMLKLMVFRYEDGRLALRRRVDSWPCMIWGQPPGEEAEGEPSAKVKVERLLERSHDAIGLDDPARREVVYLNKPG
jgi:hypothetical protein